MSFVFGASSKPFSSLFVESVIVSAVFIFFTELFRPIAENYNINHFISVAIVATISHIFFEFIGMNQFYALQYCKLI